MAVIAEAGIAWTLARTWQGSRTRERQLKRQGGASRRCPVCRAQRVRVTDDAKVSSDTSHGAAAVAVCDASRTGSR